MSRKARIPQFGSISEGTHDPQDLIPAFYNTLAYYAPRKARSIAREFSDVDDAIDARDKSTYQIDNIDTYLNALRDALEEVATRRAFCYFNSLEGDGANFGFWFDHTSYEQGVQDKEILTFSDMHDLDLFRRDAKRKTRNGDPDVHTGWFAHVNDHGNVTIFSLFGRKPIVEVV